MSLLKAIKAQLGLSNTATQNFTLTAEAADGTMKLARGNAGATTQDILTVDASGLVTAPQGLVTGRMVLETAKASTSGTSIDFTSIPSWVKRITVMLNAVSTNGTSAPLLQIGNGSPTTSGYLGGSKETSGAGAVYTTGFGIQSVSVSNILYGHMVLTKVSGNTWLSSHALHMNQVGAGYLIAGGGNITLSGALDFLRITTVNGTDTFDAGSINILYEG